MTTTLARLAAEDDTAGFWRAARAGLAGACAPDRMRFVIGRDADDLFAAVARDATDMSAAVGPIDPRLCDLVDDVILHSAPERFALAYRLLWRSLREPGLAEIAADADVAAARVLQKSVGRDKHKMKAFVRFRERPGACGPEFVAWFEPQHFIVRAVAPFFATRFAGMQWTILTPYASARWDGERLSFGPGGKKSDAPDADPLESVWKTYYGSTFNPARVKIKAMAAQMPKKYWHNMPETELIAPLIRTAGTRAQTMIEAAPTEPKRSRRGTAPASCGGAKDAGGDTPQTCTRCPLYESATRAVVGEGPSDAALMIVGEQPGDMEDLAGRPFVGPAGKLLDTALERTGIERSAAWLTNAVKHFKFEPRGKRRLHKSPSRYEIDRCRWWLDFERATIKPKVVLALGVSAVRGVTGRTETLSDIRSRAVPLDDGSQMIATVHPAFLLRLTDAEDKRREWRAFLADLQLARECTVKAV